MNTIMKFKGQIIASFRSLSSASKKIKVTCQKTNLLNINNHNTIIISQSHDIFENLALEDWLYSNYDLSSKDISILLMWYNGPSVIVGRHQNPWVECSVNFCEANNINIVRRNSGGGTVYHDFGNLNFSFITPRKKYDRKRNLELICESVRRRWLINLNITKRDDILYNNEFKKGVKSKATSSLRAKVINLNSICSDIDTIKVIEAVKDYFKQLYEVTDKNILCIHPNEDMCPGINKILEELKSWEWRFGHTPQFSITKSFPISFPVSDLETKNPVFNVEIILNIVKGRIESINLNPQILKNESYEALNQNIVNSCLSPKIQDMCFKWIHDCDDKLICQFVQHCILEMILDIFK
ncbi:lipoyltransferase 1, mitochondrial [Trichonephila clavata]|uniref:Lipoyltransferase 1, mitochondrial n=1 Tax=Trichonephila clavata TaxID=2740835 RepID=A0A8X6J0E1_TRICU|nr:lipoyltransferase 1, mitochondrial [Trichonephila clavata]